MRTWIIGACCLLGAATPAAAADFLFSFSSTPGAPGINSPAVAGTVAGRILGLPDSGTGSAAQVWIDSYSPAPLAGPVLASSWPDPSENIFTVSGGQIVAASYRSIANDTYFNQFYDQLWISSTVDGFDTNFASVGTFNRNAVWNRGGLAAVTFSRINLPVPEPGTWAMMLLGFGAIGWSMRRVRTGATVRLG